MSVCNHIGVGPHTLKRNIRNIIAIFTQDNWQRVYSVSGRIEKKRLVTIQPCWQRIIPIANFFINLFWNNDYFIFPKLYKPIPKNMPPRQGEINPICIN